MLSVLLPLVFAAQPGVVIGTNTRASTVTVSPVGKASAGLGDPPALEVMLTDVISPGLMQRRATCGPVGCPACAAHEVGTRAVCREAQCTVDGPAP